MRGGELALWLGIGGALLGAVSLEWKATTDVTSRAKTAVAACATADPTKTSCNIVARAAQLGAYAEQQATVEWRRGLIGACALGAVAPTLLGVALSTRQLLLLILLTWVIVTSMAGYSNYHMRAVVNTAIDNCLQAAVSRFNGLDCDQSLINTLMSRK